MDYVLGLDLDGVCADFYGRMREIVAEWKGVKVEELPAEVSYGLPEWNVDGEADEYIRIHRFAVTQRDLFRTMQPIKGAAQALRRLSVEGVRIRIITYRLFIPHFHHMAVSHTTEWLDKHGFRYWDLCFMKDKGLVDAHLYVEDAPENISDLDKHPDKTVIAFTNSTNRHLYPAPQLRADNWEQAEDMIRERYYAHREGLGLPLPPGPGKPVPKPSS